MKNQEITLDITDYGANFEGIGRYNNKVVFVKGALVGEKVLVKIIKETKDYCIGKLITIICASSKRMEPFCQVFGKCGGCTSQHIDYSEQLKVKKNNVVNLLKKYKVEVGKVEDTIGQGLPYYYRNKVQYPVRINKQGESVIGFYSANSHDIISNNCCYIQDRVIDMLAKGIFGILTECGMCGYNEVDFSGDIKHILIRRGYHTGQIMVVIIINNRELFNEKSFLKAKNKILDLNKNIVSIFLNLNESNTNEILGEKVLNIYGEEYITDYIGDYKFFISPKSFFQVNTIQTEILYEVLKKNLNLSKDEILFDLYSGVGSIGIFLSDSVKNVYGIEIEKTAVDMANLNLKENNITNAEYNCGSVEEKIEEFKDRNIIPNVIVVDPPRKGLDEKSIEYILDFKPEKIGYVSCNPSTLVRDLKLLSNKYTIESIVPVDMFPYTSHVESVCILKLR